jgi:hypothetical protein
MAICPCPDKIRVTARQHHKWTAEPQCGLQASSAHPRNGPSNRRPSYHRSQAGCIFQPDQDAACAPFLAACLQPPARPYAAANLLGHPPVPPRPAFFSLANLPQLTAPALDVPINLHIPSPAGNVRAKGWRSHLPCPYFTLEVSAPSNKVGPGQPDPGSFDQTPPPLRDLRRHCRIKSMTKWGVRIQSADDWGDVPMAVRGSMEEDVSPNCCASVTSSADAWIPASSSEKAIPPLQKSHHACSTNCRCRLGGGRKACAISPAWAGAVSRTCKTIESPGARSILAGTHALDRIFPKKRGTQKIRLAQRGSRLLTRV